MEKLIPLQNTFINLKDGMIFKNYKELCSFLSQPCGSGNSKIYQEELFKRFFEYHKVGHKIIIDNVYYEPIPSFGKGAYSMLIQKLILDSLVKEKLSTGKTVLYFSKNQLALSLGLVKNEYKTYLSSKNRLSELLNIEVDIIDEFYRITDGKMTGYFNTALKALENKSNIQCQNGIFLIKEHKWGGVREATVKEYEKLLEFENLALIEITKKYPNVKKDMLDRKDVFLRNEWKEYTDLVKNLMIDNSYGYIDFYFRGIKIILSSNIESAKERLDSFILKNRQEIRMELNTLFVENYKNSYSSLHDKAGSKIVDDVDNENLIMRIGDSYVSDGHDLIDATLNKSIKFGDIVNKRIIHTDDESLIPFMQ